MARKTNKTAHVLNLISKAKDEHLAMEEQMEIDNTGSDVSNDLLFMGIEPSHDKSISEEIDENLKAFVEQEEKVTPEKLNLLQENSEQAKAEINIQKEQAVSPESNPAANAHEKTLAPTHIEPEKAPISSDKVKQASPSEAPEEPIFHYLNVYERLVLERLEEFQAMFGVCTCPRCTADVISIALTNLPAKYIVTDNPRTIPLLSFYREKYRTSVAAQLSHACVQVKQKPFH